MSRRTSILKAITERLKTIDGTGIFSTNLFNNSYPKLKFWDEVNDFPSVYGVAGTETREYHPAGFAWCFLNISLKVYCKGEDSQTQLEKLLEDIELVLDSTSGVLIYDGTRGTSEISVMSITTDEGLLAPYAVGEINMLIRYQK